MSSHWTLRNPEAKLHGVAADFAVEIEIAMEDCGLSRTDLAERIGVTPARISQMLNNPGNLTLRSMITLSSALNLGVAIVPYSHGEAGGEVSLNPGVLRRCWEVLGRPKDFWGLATVEHCRGSGMMRPAPALRKLRSAETELKWDHSANDDSELELFSRAV